MQRLAEGATIQSGPMNYASFGLRMGAFILDVCILLGVAVLANMAAGLGPLGLNGVIPGQMTPGQGLSQAIQTAFGLAYEVIMVGKFGGTLGKLACGIRVVTSTGERVTYLRAFGRYFAKGLSCCTCAIGYFMAAFDEEKRTLHDRICNTRVVTK
jgi:uncharacterized RDD family membrane protein YckC